MLISEIKGWHWAITYDNPFPADSSTMHAALKKLGKLTEVQTKTTVLLAPRKNVRIADIRTAIVQNLDPEKGNVFYVNLRSGKFLQYGSRTGFKWRIPA